MEKVVSDNINSGYQRIVDITFGAMIYKEGSMEYGHDNNIPLKDWDSLCAITFPSSMGLSLSLQVSILKENARVLIKNK